MATFNIRDKRPAAPGREIQVRRTDPGASVRKMADGTKIKVRAQAPMTRPVQKTNFGQSPLGSERPSQGVIKCTSEGCDKMLIPGNDLPGLGRFSTAYYAKGSAEPLCETHWKHMTVYHPYAGLDGGPRCGFGVRFEDHEWSSVQQKVIQTLGAVGQAARRFPTPAEMDAALAGFKGSHTCPNCNTQTSWTLTSNDLSLAGVNAPWPQTQPLPWAQQQQLPPGYGQPQLPPGGYRR